jgi:hypothetical protein
VGSRQDFQIAITCSNCGQPGTVTWQESVANQRPRGPERRLIDITPGFHAETGRTQSGDAVIVCDACDQIQPD